MKSGKMQWLLKPYAGNKLIKVAFRGAGSSDVKNTVVHTPDGTTAVKAVGWDGTRVNVL